MKVIAFYLPQFHKIPENDLWWGEGFTDWEAVKNACALAEGHNQPRIPLEGYYDLLDKSVMEHQAELMHEYGIDGMCIYHYWFKDGRRILEKPAENLLRWKEIDMPYCFCWANETWARSWSNIVEKNVWANTFEQKQWDDGPQVLLKQKYGMREQWIEHFEYLLPFFRDERYIKKDNKPVFMVYKAEAIPCLADMTQEWSRLAKQNGFDGLYFIGAETGNGADSFLDALYCPEPKTSIKDVRHFDKNLTQISYDEVWNKILSAKKRKNVYLTGFVSYDDSPRRGIEGVCISDFSLEAFQKNLAKLMARNETRGMDITFLNAWNEWGESMYLEPDTRHKYGYLQAVKNAKDNYRRYLSEYKEETYETDTVRQDSDKYESYFNLLDIWMGLRERKIAVADELVKRNFHSIIIHGYGVFARHLIAELENSPVTVKCIVDQRKGKIHAPYEIYDFGDEIPAADAVVVTVPFYYNEIRQKYRKKGIINIISVEEMIRESM